MVIKGVEFDMKDEEKSSHNRYFQPECPWCGATGRNIKKVNDKSKILRYVSYNMVSMPIYANRYVCKKCGHGSVFYWDGS